MKTAIWRVRDTAGALADRLAGGLPAELLSVVPPGENRAAFRRRFREFDAWVLVMATGIAVRYLEGLLGSKTEDPAVVVIDEAARFAISLVSGHEGGANELAWRVAELTGAAPVITTATEALKPLVVGIGCRRGVSADQIAAAVESALPEGRSVGEIREVATVDLKAGEPGLREWLEKNGLPLRIVTRAQIAARPWVSAPSEWVRESIGLPGVCEPAALIASPRGELLVGKTSRDGVSVAIVEDRIEFGSIAKHE